MTTTSTISLSGATLFAIFLECILYGIYLVLYLLAAYLLSAYKQTSHIRIAFVGLATVMFGMSTAHVGIDMQRVFIAFLQFRELPGGADAALDKLNDPTYLSKSSAFVVQTALGQIFLIYRLFVVWGRSFGIIVFPILLCLGGIASGVGTVIALSLTSSRGNPDQIFLAHPGQWIVSFLAITVATSVLLTALIGYKSWTVTIKAANDVTIFPSVAGTIIESGALYTLALITLIILYLTNNFGQYTVLDALNQVIGITVTLIMLRVAQQLTGVSVLRGGSPKPQHPPAYPNLARYPPGRHLTPSPQNIEMKVTRVVVTSEAVVSQ